MIAKDDYEFKLERLGEAIAGHASSTARVYRQKARESPPLNGGCQSPSRSANRMPLMTDGASSNGF
jgi:hypothetical protein